MITLNKIDLPMEEFPTPEQMADSIKRWKESIEQSRAGTQYRMENYYNCIDDYSWGGPCDKAADWNISRCNNFISLMEEQLKNPHPQSEIFTREALADLDGNIVSERVVKTKYGFAWIIGEGENIQFVGCVKKAGTYETKGYRIVTITERVQYYYLTRETKHGLMSRSVITSREISPATADKIADPRTRMNNVIYFALNAKTY